MSISNYLEGKMVGYVFTGEAFTPPTNFYVALFTSDPGEAGSGTEVSTSGTAYARQEITFTRSNNVASNNALIEWDTAASGWGTVTFGAVYDAASSGNILASGALATPKTIATGDVFRLGVGDFTFTLD